MLQKPRDLWKAEPTPGLQKDHALNLRAVRLPRPDKQSICLELFGKRSTFWTWFELFWHVLTLTIPTYSNWSTSRITSSNWWGVALKVVGWQPTMVATSATHQLLGPWSSVHSFLILLGLLGQIQLITWWSWHATSNMRTKRVPRAEMGVVRSDRKDRDGKWPCQEPHDSELRMINNISSWYLLSRHQNQSTRVTTCA